MTETNLFRLLSVVLLVMGIVILCITHDSIGYTIGIFSVIFGPITFWNLRSNQ